MQLSKEVDTRVEVTEEFPTLPPCCTLTFKLYVEPLFEEIIAVIFGALAVLFSALDDEAGTWIATNNDNITPLKAILGDSRLTLTV